MKKLLSVLILSAILSVIASCKKDVSTTPAPVVVTPPITIPLQISIYPNPCFGHFTIQTNATVSQTVQIYDVLGRLKLNQIITGTTTIDTDSLTSGIYYVSITTNSNKITRKLIKQ